MKKMKKILFIFLYLFVFDQFYILSGATDQKLQSNLRIDMSFLDLNQTSDEEKSYNGMSSSSWYRQIRDQDFYTYYNTDEPLDETAKLAKSDQAIDLGNIDKKLQDLNEKDIENILKSLSLFQERFTIKKSSSRGHYTASLFEVYKNPDKNGDT